MSSSFDLVSAISRPLVSRFPVQAKFSHDEWFKSIGVLPKFSVPAVSSLAEQRGPDSTIEVDATIDLVFDCPSTDSHLKVQQLLIRLDRVVVLSALEPVVFSDLHHEQTAESRDILLWVKRLLADKFAEDPANSDVFKNQALILGYDPDVRRRALDTLATSTNAYARMMAERERHLEGKILYFV
jgi:hypothetical protein